MAPRVGTTEGEKMKKKKSVCLSKMTRCCLDKKTCLKDMVRSGVLFSTASFSQHPKNFSHSTNRSSDKPCVVCFVRCDIGWTSTKVLASTGYSSKHKQERSI